MTQPPQPPDDDGRSQMFGPPPESVYWDQPDPSAQVREKQAMPRQVDFGDGNSMSFEPTAEATMMLDPQLHAAMITHGRKLAETANANATIPGAEYEAVVVRGEDGIPMVHVQTANAEAELDEASFSTLTTAITTAMAGEDDE
jgi:hypothetical protein